MTHAMSRAQRRAAFLERVIQMFEALEDWYDEHADASFGEIEAEAVSLDALLLPRKALLDACRYLSTASVSATRGCRYCCQCCFNSVDGASPFRKRSICSIIR